MDDIDHEALYKQVFGESSDSEVEESIYEDRSQPVLEQNPSWERINVIKGLWLCTDFLSPKRQSSLLAAIEKEGWFNEASQNQAMRFGDLPEWAMELSDAICESVLLSDAMDLGSSGGDEETCAFPSDLLWRKPLFNQLIVNLYKPGYLCTR